MNPERKPGKLPKLTPEQRQKVVTAAAEHTRDQSLKYVFSHNWPRMEAYMPLVGMAGILMAGQLDEAEAAHLKKMIALELTQTPPQRFGRTREFLAVIAEQVEAELDTLGEYRESESNLPRGWGDVKRDHDQLKQLVAETQP